jgi:hypothetical protein
VKKTSGLPSFIHITNGYATAIIKIMIVRILNSFESVTALMKSIRFGMPVATGTRHFYCRPMRFVITGNNEQRKDGNKTDQAFRHTILIKPVAKPWLPKLQC